MYFCYFPVVVRKTNKHTYKMLKPKSTLKFFSRQWGWWVEQIIHYGLEKYLQLHLQLWIYLHVVFPIIMLVAWYRCLLWRKLNVDLGNFSPSGSMRSNSVLGGTILFWSYVCKYSSASLSYLISSPKDLFINLRGRGEREKHWYIYMNDIDQLPPVRTWPGIEAAT